MSVVTGSQRLQCNDGKTLKCPCGETRFVTDLSSGGAMAKQSGFHPMVTHMCTILWLCPKCREAAASKFVELYTLLGRNRHIAYISLVILAEELGLIEEKD